MDTAIALEQAPKPISIDKIISMALVALALIALQPLQIQEAIIVLGQGHFLACYYYQYKYGLIDRSYLVRYFGALLLLFGAYILYPNLFILVTLASIYFVVHLSVDERFLWKDRPSLKRGLAFLPFLLIYAGLIVDSIFVGHVNLDFWMARVQNLPVSILGVWITPFCLVAGGVALVAYLLWVWRQGLNVEIHDLYFLLAAAVLSLLYLGGYAPSHYYLMGAIILFHYSSWYLHYWVKWQEDRPRRRRYLVDMLAINAVVFGLYAIYRLMPSNLVVDYIPRQIYPFKDPSQGNILAYLFSPGYFYLWTLMHFVSTARRSDLAYLKPQMA